MSPEALAFLAAVYIGLAVADWYVVWRIWGPARRRPRLPWLSWALLAVVLIAGGVSLGVALGLNGIERNVAGAGFLPPDMGLILLVVALALPSGASLFLIRLLRRWDIEAAADAAHAHARRDETPRFHRRSTDPPEAAN